MDWTDDALVLGACRHGETSAVVSLLTAQHGRHAGLVRGARSARLRGVLQPGNRVRATWRARLSDHLGTLTVEQTAAYAAPLMAHPGRLAALSAACSLIEIGLPERQPAPEAFARLDHLFQALGDDAWAAFYVRWELALLAELGFGLDLGACAATGVTQDLVYVSPRSGRAVSREAGAPYRERLLPLPDFLGLPGSSADPAAILDGLRLTGHFLDAHVLTPLGRRMPDARARLVAQLEARRAAAP